MATTLSLLLNTSFSCMSVASGLKKIGMTTWDVLASFSVPVLNSAYLVRINSKLKYYQRLTSFTHQTP